MPSASMTGMRPSNRPVRHKENLYGEIFGIRHDHQAAQRAVHPALDAPIALTPDQLEKVVGGLVSTGLLRTVLVGGGATTGVVPPPVSLPSFVAF